MANNQNLISLATREERERKEIASKGGIASAKLKKERKSMREQLLILLENDNLRENIIIALINKAINGDVRAFETIRDTIGEKPIKKQENINYDVKVYEDFFAEVQGDEY